MGRPKTYTDPLTRRTLRLPSVLAGTIDRYAAERGLSANLAMIELLERSLLEARK